MRAGSWACLCASAFVRRGACRQLDIWTGELGLPKVTNLGALFSPQSFLTAVMQARARSEEGMWGG